MKFGDTFDEKINLFNDYERSASERSIKSEDDSPDRKRKLSPNKRRKFNLEDPPAGFAEQCQDDYEYQYEYKNHEFEA